MPRSEAAEQRDHLASMAIYEPAQATYPQTTIYLVMLPQVFLPASDKHSEDLPVFGG